ncbi:MAG TPA: DivIVA domain-containing protein, partial [Candidatus Faecisoma merdavium]|nr:DivIVA domain-containing protein [Candidatus Faecisoma merdavium]
SNLAKQTKEKYNLELNKLKQENLTLTSKIAQFERMEENLKRAILMAEKTSEQIKLTAYQERDIIVTDAKKNANRIVNEALLKAEEVQKETDTLRRNIIIFKRRLKEALSTQAELIEDIEKIEL